MKTATLVVLWSLAVPIEAQQRAIPTNMADSVGWTLRYTQGQFLSVAEAMPEDHYAFIPTQGNFDGVRSFAEQVKHVACGNIAFFNQIEGKTPPEHCERGGPAPVRTKPELLKYLRDSFEYGNRVLATITAENALARVEGPYAGPNTRLGMAVTAVWHVADHYGQLALYLRMNGSVPPPTQQFGAAVR